jgi:Recombinase
VDDANIRPGIAPALRLRGAHVGPYIETARAAGCTSLRQIAAALEARGVRTPGGREAWDSTQVRRVLARGGFVTGTGPARKGP